MGVMRVESYFPCEGCFFGKQHFIRVKRVCSTVFKIPLCKRITDSHPVAVPGHAARETDACRIRGEFSRSINRKT